ncbi:MAG: TlpA family protein disulfide reductase [Bacteroides sp.]|jgi:thiol-disulfide isomerase/thioredoxin|nr:TlpA family protein disulfide reductase [Bacteroides sp.]
MKKITLICFVLVTVCLGIQAKEKISMKPYFVARNTAKLEVEKVTLTNSATIMDMKIFTSSTDKVRIQSTAALVAGGKSYTLNKAEGITTTDWAKPDGKGELSFKLYFNPLPLDTKSFNFIEGPEASDWRIYGIQLTGKRPLVNIPEHLKNYQPGEVKPLPQPKFKAGNAILSGKLLGYNDMVLDMSVRYKEWLPVNSQSKEVKVNSDGTFRTEVPLLCPTGVLLNIGSLSYTLCLLPGKETVVTLNLPEIYIPQSRWFENEASVGKRIWVEGALAAFNSELVEKKYSLSLVDDAMELFKNAYGKTPVQFKEYVLKLLDDKIEALNTDRSLDSTYRAFVRWNVEMDAWRMISGYRGILRYAPMFAGVKNAPALTEDELKVDSTYYDDLLKFTIVRNPYAMYCSDYPSFALSQEVIGKGKLQPDSFLTEFVKADGLAKQMWKDYTTMSTDQQKEVDSFQQEYFKNILNDKNKELLASQAKNALKTGYKICQLDTAVTGDGLLKALVSPYKGKIVLVDMWATWCGPCKRAMKAILPMKEELKDKDIVYVYLAGDNSPEGAWKNMIPDIHGDHYRVTQKQWNDFSEKMKIEGVPTYFVIDREGDISYRATGFPGVDKMKDELNKANDK